MNRRTDFTAQLEPTLRFPEFTGEWQEKRLGEIAMFLRGSGVSKSDIVDNGNREAIRYGELYTVYNEKVSLVKSRINGSQRDTLSNKNDVILPSSGETAIDISTATFVGKDGVALGGDLNIVRTQESGLFLSYYLNHRKRYDIAKLAQGISVVHLYASNLKTLQIQLPIMEEQQKIAAFLAAVDKRVALLERKVQQLEAYKRGVMQQLLSQQLRFTRPDGSHFPAWQEIKFKDIFCRVTSKNKENNQNILTISAQYGLVSQDKFFSKIVAAKNVQGYYLLHKNDYAYNKSYSKGYPVGAIKRLTQDKGVVSTLYICFSLRQPGSEVFFDQYFESGKHNREIQKIAQEGARNHGLLNMSIDDFFNTKLIVPSAAEQQKIAEFLSALDEKIALTRQQLDKTKQFKKGLLQRMFV